MLCDGFVAGIFIVPMSGTWTVSFSFMSQTDSGDFNLAYIYHNEEQILESVIWTNSAGSLVESTGARRVFIQAEAGDTISARTTVQNYRTFDISTCIEYNSV